MAHLGNRWTLTQLKSEASLFMDDYGYVRWSETTYERAIRQAIQNAVPLWWEERLDDTNTYACDTFRYTLPPTCVSVEDVYFAPHSDNQPRRFVVPSSWHIEEESLVFNTKYTKYDGQTMYLIYVVYPSNLLSMQTEDGAIASDTTVALTSATALFATSGVRAGDTVTISDGSWSANGDYYIRRVYSETQVDLHKAPGEARTDIRFYVAHYTDLPVTYVRYFVAAILYELAARNRPGVEVSEYLQLASYYRQLAERELRSQRKAHTALRRY